MSLRSRILAVWKDPVGSNIIAGTFVTLVGSALLWLVARSFLAVLTAIVISSGLALILLLLWHRFRRKHKTLVFLSSGGTCRDPMAKTIFLQLLANKSSAVNIDVRAAGLGPITGTEASYGARYVIREMYGKDLLKDHQPELLSPDLVAQADLILAMDKSLLLTRGKTLPASKTFLLKEFLGLHGDIIDPWPDGKDADTLKRYRECGEELRTILTTHVDRILNVLDL